MEDYEKKYKAALAKAREIHRNEAEKRFDMEWLFPELKESEDERIRKDIISFLHSKNGYMNPDEDWDFHNRWLPWLEKQGEQKSFDYESANIQQKDFASVGETATIELSSPIDCGDRIYHVSHKPIEKNGEQKPAWSDEDENMANDLIEGFLSSEKAYHLAHSSKEIADWLKSLKERNTWKPSEKQIEALHNLNLIGKIDYVGQAQALIELYNDLKKL